MGYVHGFYVPTYAQQNGIAERLNKTLITRIGATLEAAALPFDKYWPWCLIDTCIKFNMTHHHGINAIPGQLWEMYRCPRSPYPISRITLVNFRVFGEHGYIPVLHAIIKKHEPRAVLARYLFVLDDEHC